MVFFDVAPLVPAAQPVALQAVEVYYRHLSPWLIGILAHGSAFKGGFILSLAVEWYHTFQEVDQ